MNVADLAFFTTSELIAELMARKTFLGLVLHAEKELRHRPWQGTQNFRLHFNGNLAADEVSNLLDVVLNHLEEHRDGA